jgi:hypothetical protein
MRYHPDFHLKQTDKSNAVILDGKNVVAEIRGLCLCNVVFRPQGRPLIAEDVPLPLYWEQYSNHQHPERNTGSHGHLECTLNSQSKVSLKIESASYSREVVSCYELECSFSEKTFSYAFDIRCMLRVPDGKRWHVSFNPSHGELEFCNLWPYDAFIPGNSKAKRYQACFVQRDDVTHRIPHHHLETSDKHNIEMHVGDRFLWLLEDENPVVEICSSETVNAGLCAYMWDAHFGYRVCFNGEDTRLSSGATYNAQFRLSSILRDEGEAIASSATTRKADELQSIPIYVDGLNTFSESLRENEMRVDVWPWEHDQSIPGLVEHEVDRQEGRSDNASLRIQTFQQVSGGWMATTLGPAFGEQAFENGKKYRLSAFVKTREMVGSAQIGVRLHRAGVGDVFDLNSYDTYYSNHIVTGPSEWQRVTVITPEINPAPDRLHLLLEVHGSGTCWFDDVIFERNI